MTRDEPIETRVGVHDSNHFELKLDYNTIPRSGGSCRYRVESYFFIPRSLGIHRDTYPTRAFHADVQAYIRFKTPALPLRALIDEDPESPLGLIRTLIARVQRAPKDGEARSRLSEEFRIFGCVARVNLRDQIPVFRTRLGLIALRPEARDGVVDEVADHALRLLTDVEELLKRWRGLKTEVTVVGFPRALLESYEYVDEYLSLMVEGHMTALVELFDKHAIKELEPVRQRARAMILEEREHQRAAINGCSESTAKEHFLYRQGLLKKFVMSVLWLEINREPEGRGLQAIGRAIAAGTAMAVALSLMMFNSKWIALNTWAFIFVASMVYILREQIKEELREYFSKRMGRFLPDLSVKIRDPITDREIGACRETVTYLPMNKVPQDVRAARHCDAKVSIEALAKPEVVIKYEKDVRLHGADLTRRLHQEDYDLNDIMRFSLSRFFQRADDAMAVVPSYDEAADRVRPRELRKVYHLNVVMVLRAPDQTVAQVMKRARVVFDKNGIVRLEDVGVSA